MLKKIFFSLLALVGLALVAGAFLVPNFTVAIPEEKVTSEIENRLPMTTKNMAGTIVVTTLDVDFLEENAVNVIASFDFDGYGLSGTGSADVTSGLRYEKGNFYLKDINLDDITLTLTEESSQKAEGYKEIGQNLFDKGVSFLGGDDETSAGRQVAQDLLENTRDKAINSAKNGLDTALTNFPVYSLNGRDIKYDLAALALEDITFSESEAVAELNPRRAVRHLIYMGFIILLSGFIGLGWALSLGGLGSSRQ